MLADVQYAEKSAADARRYARAKDRLGECVAAVWYYVSLRSDVIDIKGFGIARQRTLAIR